MADVCRPPQPTRKGPRVMHWFRRPTPEYINITTPRAPELKDRIPKDLWHKCPQCGATPLRKDFQAMLSVCPACGRHDRVGARERIAQLVDPGSFEELFGGITPADPLKFEGKARYADQIKTSTEKTGETESVICGRGEIGEVPIAIAAMDFFFIGGSMGAATGERIARTMELSLKEHIPCITVTASGGARMQEGILSLMQMAKTSILCAKLEEAGIPFISILCDPSTGGTMASFASLGDIIIAEPGANIGFAGKRVIEQTIKQQLPANFQTAEFQRDHGFVDMVVDRKRMRPTLIRLLRQMTGLPPAKLSEEDGGEFSGKAGEAKPKAAKMEPSVPAEPVLEVAEAGK